MNREEANQLKVTQLNDKMFRNYLEDCLAFGKVRCQIVLLADVVAALLLPATCTVIQNIHYLASPSSYTIMLHNGGVAASPS